MSTPDLRIVGQEWADKYPDRFLDPMPPEPRVCIICGDPQTACTGEHGSV